MSRAAWVIRAQLRTKLQEFLAKMDLGLLKGSFDDEIKKLSHEQLEEVELLLILSMRAPEEEN
jgi:hypothetical protein